MRLKTTDVYLVAYMMLNRMSPTSTQTEGRKRKKVVFEYERTNQINELEHSFRACDAMVNIHQLKGSIEQVKDLMFSALRS